MAYVLDVTLAVCTKLYTRSINICTAERLPLDEYESYEKHTL